MPTSPRKHKEADYGLAARDLVSFRFDRSTYEDRHWLLLGGIAVICLVAAAVAVIFGPGTESARMILRPIIVLTAVLCGLMIIDYARSLMYGRD